MFCSFFVSKCSAHSNLENENPHFMILTTRTKLLGHHPSASETPFKWRFAGGWMMARFQWYFDPFTILALRKAVLFSPSALHVSVMHINLGTQQSLYNRSYQWLNHSYQHPLLPHMWLPTAFVIVDPLCCSVLGEHQRMQHQILTDPWACHSSWEVPAYL